MEPSKLGAEAYQQVRAQSVRLTSRLSAEDCQIQSMPDASPTKWHLAHTTWFFETFVLRRDPDYRVHNEAFAFLFNSYYQSVGPMHARPMRGVLSRPSLQEVLVYRLAVDEAMLRGLEAGAFDAPTLALIELGLHHEQQHQELMLTDIMHAFSASALQPAYAEAKTSEPSSACVDSSWVPHNGGVQTIGHSGGAFAYDNEGPRHRVFLEPFALASRLVTNAEFLAFVNEGGYRESAYWLSAAWAKVGEQGWAHPGYWHQQDGQWFNFGLTGLVPLDLDAPVCNLSYYEADAFARWAGARLPTEFEWEASAAQRFGQSLQAGNLVDNEHWITRPASIQGMVDGLSQLAGDVWEWTSSSYAPYPGYRPAPGAVGEYNGKFMVDQYVLRGGSLATPRSHLRASYRNFFPSDSRWQFSGLRLAKSTDPK